MTIKHYVEWLSAKLKSLRIATRRGWLVESVADVPDEFGGEILYAVEMEGSPWLAVLSCPCGCKDLIYLNLLPDSRPCWTLEIDERRRPSISPSIDRTEGCRSHFFLWKGELLWWEPSVHREYLDLYGADRT